MWPAGPVPGPLVLGLGFGLVVTFKRTKLYSDVNRLHRIWLLFYIQELHFVYILLKFDRDHFFFLNLGSCIWEAYHLLSHRHENQISIFIHFWESCARLRPVPKMTVTRKPPANIRNFQSYLSATCACTIEAKLLLIHLVCLSSPPHPSPPPPTTVPVSPLGQWKLCTERYNGVEFKALEVVAWCHFSTLFTNFTTFTWSTLFAHSNFYLKVYPCPGKGWIGFDSPSRHDHSFWLGRETTFKQKSNKLKSLSKLKSTPDSLILEMDSSKVTT